MNFNIYVSKKTGENITKMAKQLHRSRNSVIVEALDDWLKSRTNSKWPDKFFDFSPIKNVPDFKNFRKDFANNVKEDPLE